MSPNLKRGTRREDGLVFLCYANSAPNGEWWGTDEMLDSIRKADADRQRKARITRKSEITAQRRKRYLEQRDKFRKQLRESYQRNRAKRLEDGRLRYARISKTPEYVEKKRIYQANFLRKNPLQRIICNIRTRIYQFIKLKGTHKTSDTMTMLGCNKEFFRQWISSQFKEGMSFENYGKWSIDHVVPLFCANNEQDLRTLSHFSNLRPEWAGINSSKQHRHSFESNEAALEEAKAKLRAASVEVVVEEVKP
jgi:hypothetical protein